MASSSDSVEIDVAVAQREEALEQFIGITGADREIASNTLEACNWDLEMAINMHVDANDVGLGSAHGLNQDDDTAAAQPTPDEKMKRLDILFRPPLDLMFRGSLENAREEGNRHNKWVLVNIQNRAEFNCLVLNRDIWSHASVKSIIMEYFIFWQMDYNTPDGQRFIQFYNVTRFPYVAVIDPRTGEMLRSWNIIDPATFSELAIEFLTENPSPNGTGDLGQILNLRIAPETTNNSDEIMETLKAAIAASLKETSKDKKAYVNLNDDDSDLETFDSDEEEFKKYGNLAIASTNDETQANSSHAKDQTTSSSNETSTNTKKQPAQVEQDKVEDWRQYLGPENGKKFEFMVRYPDGNKENISFPSGSLLKVYNL
ncbi:unnamed protein product [Sphagnum balticum]